MSKRVKDSTLTEEFWTAVEAHYAAGNSFITCGEKFGIHWHTVRRNLKARGNVTVRQSPAKDYWAKREIIREVVVVKEVEVIVEVPQPQPEAPPIPKRRIVGSNNHRYEG